MIMFKRCTCCGKEWKTKEDFLADKEVELIGYQWNRLIVAAGMPPDGLVVFTHSRDNCGTSLSVIAKQFKRDN
jgi:hypothetical protein